MIARVARTLDAVIGGDVAAMRELHKFVHDQLRAAAAERSLTVRPEAVARVLEELDAGLHAPEDVQGWASFIRSGFFSPIPAGGISPIDIEYDLDSEEEIVEALARLDELGDIIDGELRPGEAAELRRALLAASAAHSG